MIKKVLLIEPPRTILAEFMVRTRPTAQPPLGLAYIAAVLEKNHYNVKIFDTIIEDPHCALGKLINNTHYRFGLDDHKITQIIKQFNPDVVGVSCLVSVKYNDAKNICKLVKYVNPECITVMGGSHPTQNCHDVLKDDNLDYVVIGEGDYSFLELLQFIEGNRSIDTLDGIAMKKEKEIVVIPKTQYITNLDEIPFPAYHLLSLEKYWKANLPQGETTRERWMTIYTSRGCPATCIYCAGHTVWGRKYRYRSAENVLSEIEFLMNKYGIKELLIMDDNFTFNKERVTKILEGIISKGWDLSWTTPNGVAIYALDKPLLEKIKKGGCTSITLAIESGSQRVLTHVIRKPISLKKIREVVKDAKQIGLKTKAFFMLGIPDETKDEMIATIELARELKIDWSMFNITTALPGTELYDLCKRNHYIDDDVDPANVECTTAKIKTKEFDEEFVNKMWVIANNINFCENPNLMDGGDVDRAIVDFKRMIRLVPEHELAHLYLGVAYKEKKLKKEAINEWETVLKINPDNKAALQYLKNIDIIKK